mmetsp:Transcript_26557/g.85170  ORF Transcript_26557/g.85170 Transcript_26557/m.85170 type:complete len:213 (+) Transcript_26557:145-783(+)
MQLLGGGAGRGVQHVGADVDQLLRGIRALPLLGVHTQASKGRNPRTGSPHELVHVGRPGGDGRRRCLPRPPDARRILVRVKEGVDVLLEQLRDDAVQAEVAKPVHGVALDREVAQDAEAGALRRVHVGARAQDVRLLEDVAHLLLDPPLLFGRGRECLPVGPAFDVRHDVCLHRRQELRIRYLHPPPLNQRGGTRRGGHGRSLPTQVNPASH